MRILMINKYHYLRGGSERYYFDLTDLLESRGHSVIPFAMAHPRNLPTPWSRYFVPNIEYNAPLSPARRVAAAVRMIYYPRARRAVEQLIALEKPDIVHAHNLYHQLSYSPLWAARRRGVPVVLTAHDLKLVCANYQMLRRGRPCSLCLDRRHARAFIKRCGREERYGNSLALALEMLFNRRLFDVVRRVDAIIAPSRFLRSKLIEGGIPDAKALYHPNFVEVEGFRPRYGGEGYVLYAGRLSREKGLSTLVRAMGAHSHLPLRIAGEGPYEETLRREIADARLPDAQLLGHCDGERLAGLIRNASIVVAPSEIYENCPYSVLEALACGKPVIGARIGGIPELIDEGRDGYLFEPGDADDLADKIGRLAGDETRIAEFGRNARRKAEERFAPQAHYRFMLNLYEGLVGQKG